ncbi:hypothetical protein TNIN_383181 [Trichonephila inaurata madagascariensis]|uniref:Uncharacterized protein n=1 Tax=Trichonephila inaurata madagascariensis TaxID=2747483 RepID=A0A8X7BUT1_9ARAC|nr:hypothetical protein TNIN_383181 [Trichonephila inaurata madagascariensis]
MPYGAKKGCSKIFRLVDDKFPKSILPSDETINAQLIERIAKRVLSEEAAKKLTASENQGIPPPKSADLTATSSTLPRRRKPGSLSYSQWKRKKGKYFTLRRTINVQLIERIAKKVLSEEAAKKLTATDGQGIPPPQSADLKATSSTLARR